MVGTENPNRAELSDNYEMILLRTKYLCYVDRAPRRNTERKWGRRVGGKEQSRNREFWKCRNLSCAVVGVMGPSWLGFGR